MLYDGGNMIGKIIVSILMLFMGTWNIYMIWKQFKNVWGILDKVACYLIGIVSIIGSIIIWWL